MDLGQHKSSAFFFIVNPSSEGAFDFYKFGAWFFICKVFLRYRELNVKCVVFVFKKMINNLDNSKM